MSYTIDDLCQSSCYRRRTSHATPARSHHTGLGLFCTTVFAPGLAPCSALTLGGNSRPWCTHGDSCITGDGAGGRAPLHELSSGPEQSDLVGPPWESDSVRVADHAAGPLGSDDRSWGGRYGGAPVWSEDPGERLLPGCGALREETRHLLFRPEMGRDDAPGASALESTSMGVALSHHAVLACRASRPAPAQDQCRLGTADHEAGASLAARTPSSVGRRRGLCCGGAGLGVRQKPGGYGLALALGCRPVSPAGAAASRQAWPQTHQRKAPTALAGVGHALRYPLGNCGGGLVRRPAEEDVGLLAHGPMVHPRLAPRRHPLCPGLRPRREAAHGSLFLYRPAGHPGADPGVGRHALVRGSDL